MPRSQATPGFAIIRVDDYFDEPLTASNVEERITITKVVANQERADSEVARLNELLKQRGQARVRYYAQYVRLLLDDGTA